MRPGLADGARIGIRPRRWLRNAPPHVDATAKDCCRVRRNALLANDVFARRQQLATARARPDRPHYFDGDLNFAVLVNRCRIGMTRSQGAADVVCGSRTTTHGQVVPTKEVAVLAQAGDFLADGPEPNSANGMVRMNARQSGQAPPPSRTASHPGRHFGPPNALLS